MLITRSDLLQDKSVFFNTIYIILINTSLHVPVEYLYLQWNTATNLLLPLHWYITLEWQWPHPSLLPRVGRVMDHIFYRALKKRGAWLTLNIISSNSTKKVIESLYRFYTFCPWMYKYYNFIVFFLQTTVTDPHAH